MRKEDQECRKERLIVLMGRIWKERSKFALVERMWKWERGVVVERIWEKLEKAVERMWKERSEVALVERMCNYRQGKLL